MRIVSLLFLLATSWSAAEMPTPLQATLQAEGDYCFTDGSSLYRLSTDGSFSLQPAGMSGRTIEGAWGLADGARVTVVGQWGWVNGLSPLQDYRQMVLYLSDHGEPPGEVDPRSGCKLSQPYFTVEGVTPLRVQAYASANLKVSPARPDEPLSLEDAQRREAAGEAWYQALYDADDRLVSLEKRLGGERFFRYLYRYEGDKVLRLTP